MTRSRHRALGIALIYAVLGALWITWSDAAVELFARDSANLTRLQTWKGWLYVAVTALLIYLLVRRALRSEQRLSQSLRQTEERLRLVLDTIPSRVLWKDRSGKYLGGNRRFALDVGLPESAELKGHRDSDLPWHDQLALISESDDLILDGHRNLVEFDAALRSLNGRPFHASVTKVPLRVPEGGIGGILTIYDDITARKEAERQSRHSQKLQAIGELTSGVTHDFKNVLSVITANAELVGRSLPPDSEEATAMSDLLASSRNAAGMVRKLLGFSRQGDLILGTIDLRPVVSELAPTLSRLLGSGYRLEVKVDPEPRLVRADPDAVEQMLLNLITNARDAMPEGGDIRVRVHGPVTNWERDEPGSPPAHLLGMDQPPTVGEYVVIEVGDTGTGITPEVVDRILEPFYTTKPTGHGTGLGLPMVYGLMRQHGGFVTLRTAPGWGAVFALHFPLLPEDTPVAERRRRTSDGPLPHGSETILIVDDQEEMRRTGGRVLRRHGYTVIEAADGIEALAILRRDPGAVDLVLTDYMMPEMNGAALIRQLRSDGNAVKVAMSSGHAEFNQSPGLAGAKEIPMIAKPWTMEELVTAVREVLDGVR